jgi:hypothetical protein
LSKEQTFDEGIKLLVEMHGLLHDSGASNNGADTMYDSLWRGLKEETCKIIFSKATSIAWNIWHITRIEDIVANMLIGNTDEVLNILAKLNITVRDTGNAMDRREIDFFDKNTK